MSDLLLTKENLTWRDIAREVAEKHIRPIAAEYDRRQEYPWEAAKALASAGLFGTWIPKEYGGSAGETPVLDLCLVVEELSRVCGGMGVGFAVNALGSFPILLAGTDEQKQRYLPDVAAGRRLIAFCLSEKMAGSDAGSMATRAVKDGDHFVISGEKKWTTNGGVAEIYSVFAVTDPNSRSRRISAFVVEKGMPGFSIGKIEDKMGIRCIPVVETIFDQVRVGPANLLGGREGYGFKHAMETLDHARPGVAAQAVGLAQGALDYALHWVSRRVQFGAPLSSQGQIQGRLADMQAKVSAARHLVHAAALNIDRGASNIGFLAAQAKLFATNAAMEVTTEAVQLFGGYGFMKDYPIEKFMRDAKITQIYEGTNEIQRLVISRNLIKSAMHMDHLAPYCPMPWLDNKQKPN
ncbi:MAG: acyl-CoA dehydrogenase family protein [Planctomycetes bacterium]|jgi:butyryl-CoA dehydrogenase|nr:acyl-CoA dehydrogenase family protein [Planctomycetota bacterium]